MIRYELSIEEICKKLKPLFGRKIDLLYLKYSMSDRDAKMEIEQALKLMYEKYLNTTLLTDKILLEPPAKEMIAGEYQLGVVQYAETDLYPFGLRDKDWIRHVCISGMSGSGKTNFAYQILGNFIKKGKPFLVFDWKKSFRPLLLLDDKILCFTIGNESVSNLFKFNINQPPDGVDPQEWISILCDLITESFFASFGTHKLLMETLEKSFRDFGVYNGSKNYPTWYQIKDRLERRAADLKGKSREAEWIESALRIAHALTFGTFGETVNSKDKYAMTIDELVEKKVVFELNSLNNSEKKFFCEYMLTFIYKRKKAAQQEAGDHFKSAIVVDEAHNVFLKDRPNFIRESVTDMVYRELREYGISLVCLDQHISKLSETVAGNSATNVAFQQVLPDDVDAISGLMQLRDKKQYFSMLPVGQAVIKLADRFYTPFLIKVPLVSLKSESVSDNDLRERMITEVRDTKRMKMFREGVKEEHLQEQVKKLEQKKESTIMYAAGVNAGESLPEPETVHTSPVAHEQIGSESADDEPPTNTYNPPNTIYPSQTTHHKPLPTNHPPQTTTYQPQTSDYNPQVIHDEPEEKKVHLRNHLQQDLVRLIMQHRNFGYPLAAVKATLLAHGYSRADIMRALNHLKVALESKQNEPIPAEEKEEQKYEKEGQKQYVADEVRAFTREMKENKKVTPAAAKAYVESNPEAARFLAILRKKPQPTTAVYKQMKMSTRQCDALKRELLDIGLIEAIEERSTKGKTKVLKVTVEGASLS